MSGSMEAIQGLPRKPKTVFRRANACRQSTLILVVKGDMVTRLWWGKVIGGRIGRLFLRFRN